MGYKLVFYIFVYICNYIIENAYSERIAHIYINMMTFLILPMLIKIHQTFEADFVDVLNLNKLKMTNEFCSIFLNKIGKEIHITIIAIFENKKMNFRLGKLIFEDIFQIYSKFFFNFTKSYQKCISFKVGDLCLPPQMYNRSEINKMWQTNFR